VGLGILKSVQDGLVLAVEGDAGKKNPVLGAAGGLKTCLYFCKNTFYKDFWLF
jgi:hypothetical protein